MNLIELLPIEDKKLMEKYINIYGVGEEDFIGLDEYLKYWAESNKKLYKLLGNQFQLEIPYDYEKSHSELRLNFRKRCFSSSFFSSFRNFLYENPYSLDKEIIDLLWMFADVSIYLNDKIPETIKFIPKEGEKELCLPAGMKPVRALGKIAEAYSETFSIPTFEDFRIQHSLCLNERKIKGTLVLSIHPFDFITMSDNDSNWSSCMTWTKGEGGGCYHMGTVEMMNSNNVIVAYLKSSSPFNFGKNAKDENLVWNNKKWRQLVHFTKDIIVTGKPYPYVNRDLSFLVLEELKKLAENNLSYKYKYGPEEYLDMVHINTLEAMENNKIWLREGRSFKHNIIFDTKGMYNDMLNDSDTQYWCYRNKVKKMKIISISGKAPCACCGNDALVKNDYPGDYNDRWDNPKYIICNECLKEGECNICCKFIGKKTLFRTKDTKVCPACCEKFLKICPCCNKELLIPPNKEIMVGIQMKKDAYYDDYERFNISYYNNLEDYISSISATQLSIVPAFLCDECLEKDLNNENGFFEKRELPKSLSAFSWRPNFKQKIITKRIYTEEEIAKHPVLNNLLIANLKNFDFIKN